MSIPSPRSWVGGVTAFTAVVMNLDLRDSINFLLGVGAGCKDYAKLRISTSPSIAANTIYAIPFDLEDWDSRNGHGSVSPTVYYPQEAGKYRITGQIGFANNATGMRQVYVRQGVSLLALNTTMVQAVAAGYPTIIPFTVDVAFVVGDWFELIAYHTASAPVALSGPNTFMVVEWIAA